LPHLFRANRCNAAGSECHQSVCCVFKAIAASGNYIRLSTRRQAMFNPEKMKVCLPQLSIWKMYSSGHELRESTKTPAQEEVGLNH
ncbi:hypothetical protein PENTCL1PPCAC_15573, partial [Pristionchus entomophagus]